MNKLKYILLGIFICYISFILYFMVNTYFFAKEELLLNDIDLTEYVNMYNEKLSKVNRDNLTENGIKCLSGIEKYYDEITKAKLTVMNAEVAKQFFYTDDPVYNVNYLSVFNSCFDVEDNRTAQQEKGAKMISPLILEQMIDLDVVYKKYYNNYQFKIGDKYIEDIYSSDIYEMYYDLVKRTEMVTAISLLDYLEYKEVTS